MEFGVNQGLQMVQVVSRREEYLKDRTAIRDKLKAVLKEPPLLAQVYKDHLMPSRELIFLQS